MTWLSNMSASIHLLLSSFSIGESPLRDQDFRLQMSSYNDRISEIIILNVLDNTFDNYVTFTQLTYINMFIPVRSGRCFLIITNDIVLIAKTNLVSRISYLFNIGRQQKGKKPSERA